MVAKEQGFDLVLIGQNETAGTTPPVSNAILVPSKSTITTLADLKGKRIGTASPRGQSFAAVKELFQRVGLSVADVQMIEAPFTSHADLLRSGRVDAVVALNPYTTQITKAGWGRPLSWYMIETIPDQPVGAWWALRPWAQQHPQEIAAFQQTITESHEYMNADPERAKKLISEYSGLDFELVDDMRSRTRCIQSRSARNPPSVSRLAIAAARLPASGGTYHTPVPDGAVAPELPQ
jgi:NitT/TauT family transport system substrate-binding protein